MSKRITIVILVVFTVLQVGCQGKTSVLPQATSNGNQNAKLGLNSPYPKGNANLIPVVSPNAQLAVSPGMTNRMSPGSPTVNPTSILPGKPAPVQINKMESDSKTIMAEASKKNWKKVNTAFLSLKNNLARLRSDMLKTNINNKNITREQENIKKLEANITGKKVLATKLAANTITGILPDIADAYKATVPTDVGRLCYLGRQILLDLDSKKEADLRNNYQKITQIWSGLNGRLPTNLRSKGNAISSSIKVMGQSIDKLDNKAIKLHTNKFLDRIETLKKDFERK